MPVITYINADNQSTKVEVAVGLTVMHGATINMIDGILAECGGGLTCATCHCYVDKAWVTKTGAVNELEDKKLNLVNNRQENSRLSCQIIVDNNLDGLIILLPETQVLSQY